MGRSYAPSQRASRDLGHLIVANYFAFFDERADDRVTMVFVTRAGVRARSVRAAEVPSDDRSILRAIAADR